MAKNSNLTKAKKYELMDGQQRTLFHGPRAAGQNTITSRCSVLDATGAGGEHGKGRLGIPSRPLFLLNFPATDVEVFATAIFRCEILRIVSPFVDSYFFLVCGVALLLKTVQYFCCDIQDYGKSPSKTSAIAISKSSYRLHLKCVTTAARSSAFIFAST